MTDDNAPRSSNPAPLITAARVAAVVLAIAVVAWLIVRAQRDADRQQREAPADAGAPASPTPGEGEAVDELLHGSKSAVLPSSKSLVIDPNMTVLPSSKFMPLPSSKGMVVEPPAGPRPATQPEKAKPEKEGGS